MKTKSDLWQLHIRAATVILILLIISTGHTQAQDQKGPKPLPTVGLETYEKVLELIFPVELPMAGSYEHAWMLRYLPSKEADSQITIIKRVDGVEVVELKSMDGNVYEKLQEILERTGRKDPVEMAKLIRIRKRVVKVSPAQVAEWRNGFIQNTHKTLKPRVEPSDKSEEGAVVLHGTSYVLRYTDGSLEILYNTSGWEVGSDIALSPKEAPPLVVWMNQIWREIKGSPSIRSH